MLHLIFCSPLEKRILARVDSRDAAVFLGDAVYSVLRNGLITTNLQDRNGNFPLFVLSEDISSRGINFDELDDVIEPIDYHGFVSLTTRHTTIQTWY
ncbi:MAG: sulfurtransferase complex subunit TusB [Gammaproteobacteria bacterium]